MKSKILIGACLASLIMSCQAPAPKPAGGNSNQATNVEEDPDIENLPEAGAGVVLEDREFRQFIADILFEGLQALDRDRLLLPVDNNAYARFQRVLAYEPANEIALQGIRDIAARYLALSSQASRRGLFEEAMEMLENARFVDAEHPELPTVWLALQAEINSGDLFFNLDGGEMTRRSERAQERLIDIARQARQHNANFLITAPNDDLARWMFSVMREAVDGYRLRGNIELASRTTVRLRIPRP